MTKVHKRYMNPDAKSRGSLPILSFFSGAGFLDIGFIQTGFDIVWSNEFNTEFARAYRYGLTNIHKHLSPTMCQNTESIISLSPERIIHEAFQGNGKPPVFGVIGGPPCPDFSSAGKNRGGEGDNGKLSQVYVNYLIALKPTFFLFENVPGLVKTKKHRIFFDGLYDQLKGHFALDWQIINALDFGLPQDRDRLFLVGVTKDWIGLKGNDLPDGWFPWPQPIYKNAKGRFNWPDTSTFGSEPPKPLDIPSALTVEHAIGNLEEILRLPNGTEGFSPKSDKFLTVAEGDVFRKSFKRLHRYRYSPTAAYGHNEVHLHPTQPRRLTVREALRLQGVPDSFVLPEDMSLSNKFKMIGNGVPVNLAAAMASAFAELFQPKVRFSKLDTIFNS